MSAAIHPHLAGKPDLNEVLLSWKADSHPFKKRDRVFYQTVAALSFLFIVIVFFLHEFLMIGVILSIAFVVYVIATIPPVEVEHKITPLGFMYAGRLYPWPQLDAFWFDEKWGQKMIVFHNRLTLPTQLRAVLGDMPESKIKLVVGKYLFFMETPPKSWTDHFSQWLEKKFPLEATSS